MLLLHRRIPFARAAATHPPRSIARNDTHSQSTELMFFAIESFKLDVRTRHYFSHYWNALHPITREWSLNIYAYRERSSIGLRATCSRKGRHRFLHDVVKLFPVVALCMLKLMKFQPDIHKKVKKTRLRSFQILALLMPLWAPPHFFASWYVRATRDEFNIHQIWS